MTEEYRINPREIRPLDDTGADCADGQVAPDVVGGKITGFSPIAVSGLTDPTTTKGDLIARGASSPPTRLAVGSNGQVLTADSTQTTGVKWATPASGSVATDTIWDTKGDLAVATGADTAAKLVAGSNGQVLTADSTQTTGLKWATPSSGGTLTVQDENSTVASGVTQLDFQGAGVTAASGTGEVVVTIPGETLPASLIDAKGDLIVGTADNTAARLGVGSNNYVLTADTGVTGGVKWAPAPGAGGGTVKDPRWYVGSGETSIDEFNDSSLDAAWVQVDAAGGSGRIAWTESADVLSLATAGGDAATELHGLMRPLTGAGGTINTGDGFVIPVTLLQAANHCGVGVAISDGTTHGAGNQIAAVALGNLSVSARPLTNWTTQGTISTTLTFVGNFLYMRLSYQGSNNWRVDASPDNVSWIKGSNLSKTFTPSHVGIVGSSFGTATKGAAGIEFLRRVSGIT